MYNLLQIVHFPQDEVLERVNIDTGEEILPTKDMVWKNWKREFSTMAKKTKYTDYYPRNKRSKRKVEAIWQDNKQSIISVNSNTTDSKNK